MATSTIRHLPRYTGATVYLMPKYSGWGKERGGVRAGNGYRTRGRDLEGSQDGETRGKIRPDWKGNEWRREGGTISGGRVYVGVQGFYGKGTGGRLRGGAHNLFRFVQYLQRM